MTPILISLIAFVGVTALVGGLFMLLRAPADTKIESRLVQITTAPLAANKDALLGNGILSQPLDAGQDFISMFLERFGKFALLFEQADTTLTPSKFALISGVMAVAGIAASLTAGL